MTNAKTTIAAMLTLALSAAPLAACGGQANQGDAEKPAAEQTSQSTVEESATEQTPAASMDVSSWKTLGDALAYDTGENTSAGWNEEHYITVFTTTDGSVVRVVAKMDEETYNKHAALEMSDDDYQEQFLEVMGGLPLESAEDLTDQLLTQDEMDAYAGKTGQDLVDEGYAFEGYWMYGGDETGATMAKGPLAYSVTFDVTVPDDEANSDEEGAAVLDAPIVSMEFAGASYAATDPENV